jgi:hypothetical protein
LLARARAGEVILGFEPIRPKNLAPELVSIRIWRYKIIGRPTAAVKFLPNPSESKFNYVRKILRGEMLVVGLRNTPIIWMEVIKYQFDWSCRMTYCPYPSSGFDYRSNTLKGAAYDSESKSELQLAKYGESADAADVPNISAV